MTDQNKNNHLATTPNRKPPTAIDKLKVQMSKDYLTQVTNFYGGNKEEALRFMSAAIEYVRRVPKLLETNQMSLMNAFVQVAQFRFMPSGVSGEAYIIPYGTEAKFQLGYQGIVTLLYRTNKVVGITSNIIYKNDVFEYEEGLNARLVHKPAMFGAEKGAPIGVYTVAEMSGGAKTFKVMDEQAIMGIKNLSKAKGSKESPWNSDKDPEMWMWKKTCLIQHAKLLPKTQELQKAIEADYEGEGMDKPHLDAGGAAVGRAFHGATIDNTSDKHDGVDDIHDDELPDMNQDK
jgi:recombination protein RecT